MSKRSYEPVKAPHGTTLSCKSWLTEAPLRMLMNNLDPEVAEDPERLVVYGGSGKAARTWEDYDAICAALRELEDDETLLMQSGRAVGVFKTHADAPRVLIANSNLVPKWATWEHFNELEAEGLTMFGQMTAGSWIYIGSQGIVQGTYETFAAAADRHFDGELSGRLIVSGGLGGMGGAQPLAACLAGGTFLAADVDPHRIEKRLETRYIDMMTDDLGEAIRQALEWKDAGEAKSVGWVGNQVDLLHALIERDIVPDLLTDQTSAHDPVDGYVPTGMTFEEAVALRARDRDGYRRRSLETMVAHIAAMRALQDKGAITFDYGNNLRGFATEAGSPDAFQIPGFVPEYIRPLFCSARGRSAGRRSAATRRTSPRRTRPCCASFRLISRSRAGSRWPGSASPTRACPRASAGWVTATARSWVSRSTASSAPGRSLPRSPSGATISTAARWPRRTVRPRA